MPMTKKRYEYDEKPTRTTERLAGDGVCVNRCGEGGSSQYDKTIILHLLVCLLILYYVVKLAQNAIITETNISKTFCITPMLQYNICTF